jgi:hypothetical protein
MGVYGGVQLPNINEQSMDDRRERKQILNYLAMLDEKLRYMFQNIDIEDNFSEGAKKEYHNTVVTLGNLAQDTMKVVSDLNGNYSAVVQDVNRINSKVSNLDDEMGEKFSMIDQTAEKIEMIVSSVDGTSSLTLTDEMFQAIADKIQLVGEVEIKTTEYGGITGGYIGYGQGNDGVNTSTNGIVVMDSGKTNYLICTNSGVRMTAGSNGVVVTPSSISATKTITVSSDRRLKEDISYDMEKYEEMFMKLKPCGYRYKGDTEGQIGFIAQEVEEVSAEGFDPVSKGEYLALGYNNFIALNTHMIQKLMARVSELESKLEALS